MSNRAGKLKKSSKSGIISSKIFLISDIVVLSLEFQFVFFFQYNISVPDSILDIWNIAIITFISLSCNSYICHPIVGQFQVQVSNVWDISAAKIIWSAWEYRTNLNKHNIHCFDTHGLLAVSKISISHKCLHNSHE